MNMSFTKRAIVSALCLSGLAACSGDSNEVIEMTEVTEPTEEVTLAANLETAEGMIDAFYTFDPTKLEPFLSQAGDSAASILGYQA